METESSGAAIYTSVFFDGGQLLGSDESIRPSKCSQYALEYRYLAGSKTSTAARAQMSAVPTPNELSSGLTFPKTCASTAQASNTPATKKDRCLELQRTQTRTRDPNARCLVNTYGDFYSESEQPGCAQSHEIYSSFWIFAELAGGAHFSDSIFVMIILAS